MSRPGLGESVHYVSHGSPNGEYKSACQAAIVTEAPPNGRGRPSKKVGLIVLNPTGIFFKGCLQDEDTKAGGTWHWPEAAQEEVAPARRGAQKAGVQSAE